MSTNNLLFVFEGDRTERQIVDNLQRFFVNENTVIQCVYCGEIYQIYEDISKDEDLDIFNLIKERGDNNRVLRNYNRGDFAEIYMFFDYDAHSNIADDDELKELLEFFNEETDKGKLYISYPMVEALKHISDYDTFRNLKVKCKENIDYKNLVSEDCMNHLKDFTQYERNIWIDLLKTHLYKMNYIVNDIYNYPNSLISQPEILKKQLSKYVTVDSTVAVLSSFPVFLHDYYGNYQVNSFIFR